MTFFSFWFMDSTDIRHFSKFFEGIFIPLQHRDDFFERLCGFRSPVVLSAHDDKLWVTAPGLKFVHPRGASLNDFELFEVLIPISVGSPYDVLCLLVRGFNVPQRNFPVTCQWEV